MMIEIQSKNHIAWHNEFLILRVDYQKDREEFVILLNRPNIGRSLCSAVIDKFGNCTKYKYIKNYEFIKEMLKHYDVQIKIGE